MHVVATAGHVDHGKSTLVEALTGQRPDRLAEEQRRGLSIALDALQHVRRIAALERLDDAVVHLPCGGGDFVEEPAVVRHQQQPAAVARPALL